MGSPLQIGTAISEVYGDGPWEDLGARVRDFCAIRKVRGIRPQHEGVNHVVHAFFRVQGNSFIASIVSCHIFSAVAARH